MKKHPSTNKKETIDERIRRIVFTKPDIRRSFEDWIKKP